MYPDDSVQAYTTPWWVENTANTIVRGRLLWAHVAYPEMKPYRLVPEGRGDDPRQHTRAQFRIETFRIGDPPIGVATLPVAALPARESETYLVLRGKRRPAVVASTGGPPVARELRAGAARWQSAPTIVVAPYYGSEQNAARGGWPLEFVDRIRPSEYPQYMWDLLPTAVPPIASILRLDHLFAIGADPANWTYTPYVLSDEALGLLNEWVAWLLTDRLPVESGLAYLRANLPTV